MIALELIQLARRSPSIPRPIDNTALDSYMSCPRKYYYSMVLNRRRRGLEKPALAYGTTWHAIMEAHYKTGGDVKAIADAAVKSWKPHGDPDDHRTLERAITEYGKWLQNYGDFEQEQAAWGRTVGYPDSPVIEYPCELWWPGALHPYTGKIDRIFEHQGLYYVEDHKTSSAMGPYYFKQFDPSAQMMGYAWLAQLLTGLPIAGVRINAHAVLKGSSKFARQTIHISDDRLTEFGRNYNSWIKRLEESYSGLSRLDESGDAERESRPDGEHWKRIHAERRSPDEHLLSSFPHNFNACAGKYGQCTYTDVCTYPANLRERILEANFDDSPWNPLNPDGDEDAS